MTDPFQNDVVENTPYAKQRREEMRLRTVRYGFFRVVKEPVQPFLCFKCGHEIHGERLMIDGKIYHYRGCF